MPEYTICVPARFLSTQTGHACCIQIANMFATSMCLNIQCVCLLVFSPHTHRARLLHSNCRHVCYINVPEYTMCVPARVLSTQTGHACCIQIAGMFATSMCLNIQCVCLLVFSPHKQGTLAAWLHPSRRAQQQNVHKHQGSEAHSSLEFPQVPSRKKDVINKTETNIPLGPAGKKAE